MKRLIVTMALIAGTNFYSSNYLYAGKISNQRVASFLAVATTIFSALAGGEVEDNPGNCLPSVTTFSFPFSCDREDPNSLELKNALCPGVSCLVGTANLILDLEWPEPKDCCEYCSCTGDPHCISFDNIGQSIRFCDPRLKVKGCPQNQAQCEKQKVLSAPCRWTGNKKFNACVFKGPFPSAAMYKIDGIQIDMRLGQSGSINDILLEGQGIDATLEVNECLKQASPWKIKGNEADRLSIVALPATGGQKKFEVTAKKSGQSSDNKTSSWNLVVVCNTWHAINAFVSDVRRGDSEGFCSTNVLGGPELQYVVKPSTEMARFCNDRKNEGGIPSTNSSEGIANPNTPVNPIMDAAILWHNEGKRTKMSFDELPTELPPCVYGYELQFFGDDDTWHTVKSIPWGTTIDGPIPSEDFPELFENPIRFFENLVTDTKSCGRICQSRGGKGRIINDAAGICAGEGKKKAISSASKIREEIGLKKAGENTADSDGSQP